MEKDLFEESLSSLGPLGPLGPNHLASFAVGLLVAWNARRLCYSPRLYYAVVAIVGVFLMTLVISHALPERFRNVIFTVLSVLQTGSAAWIYTFLSHTNRNAWFALAGYVLLTGGVSIAVFHVRMYETVSSDFVLSPLPDVGFWALLVIASFVPTIATRDATFGAICVIVYVAMLLVRRAWELLAPPCRARKTPPPPSFASLGGSGGSGVKEYRIDADGLSLLTHKQRRALRKIDRRIARGRSPHPSNGTLKGSL